MWHGTSEPKNGTRRMARVYRQRLGNRNAHDTEDSVGSFWVEIFRTIELLFFIFISSTTKDTSATIDHGT